MRHKFLQRIMGIFLAGMMCLDSSAALAAELVTDTISVEEIQSEQTGSDQMELGETDTEITEDTEGSSAMTDSISEDSDASYYAAPADTENGGAPAAPADLEIASQTEGGIKLIWKAVEGCDGYKVYRRTRENAEFEFLTGAKTDSNTVAYTDHLCEIGQWYEYAVTAYVTVEENKQELESAYSNVVNNAEALTGITLDQNDLQMNKGDKRAVKVSYEPVYTTDDRTVTWKSSAPAVVEVKANAEKSSEAEITAFGAGEATITAKVGKKETSCIVTVKAPLASIRLNQTELTLENGRTDTLTLFYDPSDTTDDRAVTWTSSAPAIVEVKAKEGNSSKAEITAHGKGEATITATVGEKKTSCKVTVRVPAASIAVDKTFIELKAAGSNQEGENKNSEKVNIFVTPGDTTDKITCEAEDDLLVDCAIAENGAERILTITPKGEFGETQITVKAGNKKAVLSVRITPDGGVEDPKMPIPVNAVVIDKTELTKTEEDEEDKEVNGAINLQFGGEGITSKEITAKCLPETATSQTLTWTSSNETIASVSGKDGTATVTAKGVGSAVITATADNGVSDSVNVVVQRSDTEIIIENGKDIVLYCNEDKLAGDINKTEIKAEHTISMEDTTLTYEYHSSNSEVAGVDQNGKINAKAPGKADITVLHRESGSIAVVKVTVKRLVEKISLPQTEKGEADAFIRVVKGKTTKIPLSLVPGTADKECLDKINVVSANSKKFTGVIEKGAGANRTLAITAKESGVATLTITTGDSYTTPLGKKTTIVSAQFHLRVEVVDNMQQVNTIKLIGTNKMASGTEQELGISLADKDRDEIDKEKVTLGFGSSNEEIATVDETGKVTALKGGKVTITAYTLDGSNKKATYAITVEQRPDTILFDREIYGVNKPAKTATLKLTPLFSPSNTAASQKKVKWEIVSIEDEKGNAIEEQLADYFTVNTSGVVTVKNKAVEGMKAKVRCTSTAYTESEKKVSRDITVLVQPKKVKTLKFNVPAPQVVGLKEHELKFTTTFEKDASQDIDYQAASSDEAIATVTRDVTDGSVKLQAKKYGTVTITLCADNVVTASCKVTIRPLEKGKKIAAKSARYLIQQTKFDANDKVKLEFVDAATKKEVIDPGLFTYKSSDSNTVYVDESGVAYVNPGASIPLNGKEVTITASLTEDLDKRKATTKVKVCGKNQIARMDVKYYESVDEAEGDQLNIAGQPLADGITMKGERGKRFVLRIIPYDAGGNKMQSTSMKFVSSDTSRAKIVSQKRGKDIGDSDFTWWEITVSIQNPGKFSITATADDDTKVFRKLDFGAYDGAPILASAGLGTIHKNGSRIKMEDKGTGIAAQSNFILMGANGTTIRRDSVIVKEATVKVGKKETSKLDWESFVIKPDAEDADAYRLIIDEKKLSQIMPGTYNVTLQVTRTALAEESGSGIGSGKDVRHEIKTTFTVVDTMPVFSDARVTLNTFIEGDTVKIPFKTTWKQEFKILDVKPQAGLAMANEIDIINDGFDWYVSLKESQFEKWKKSSTSGKLDITLEGYDKPVTMRLIITTKSTKPVIKQEAMPSVHLEYDRETAVTLVDAKKNVYSGYEASLKDPKPKDAYTIETSADTQAGMVKVSFKEDVKPGPKGVIYKQTIQVKKPEWRDPVDVPISVKAYSGTSTPTVSFANSTLYINRYSGVEESIAETAVRISHSNIKLQEGEWTIPAKYKYDNKKKGDNNIAYDYADAFKAEYKDGKLTVSLRDGEDIKLQNTTYTFKMEGLELEKEGTQQLPLIKETAQIKVVVRTIAPAVTVKMSGKLDLINRSTSTLKGTVTVKNVNSSVKRIDLDEELQKNYYCTRKDNTFTLYGRSNAVLTTAKVTGDIAITMTDDRVLHTKITFTPTQGTPKIGTPKPLTIYKSAASQTVDYDFNEDITKGVKVESVETITLPEGLKVQESGGHLFVTLQNKTLKAGTYTIKVNLYLKGAQEIKNSPKGKAVQKTINVIVKE